MRFTSAVAAALLGVAATLVQSKPMTEVTTTAISVDQNDAAFLSAGELTMHVVRVDDLLSDATPAHERSLILERLTHLVLRIRIDPEQEQISINDAVLNANELAQSSQHTLTKPVNVAEPAQAVPRVQAVRVEALKIPKGDIDVDGKIMSTAQVEELAGNVLPPGLVAAEIIVHEKPTAMVGIAAREDEMTVVTARTFSVSVKITEIEKQAISHETTVNVPVLKILLEAARGDKALSMKAFAVRQGTSVSRQHLSAEASAPQVDGPKVHGQEEFEAHKPHFRHSHHHDGPPAFVQWLASLFGYKEPPRRHLRFRGGVARPHVFGDPHHRPSGPLRPVGGPDAGPVRLAPPRHIGPHGPGLRRPPPHGGPQRSRFTCRMRHFLHSPEAFLIMLLGKVVLTVTFIVMAIRKVRAWRSEKNEGAIRLREEEEVLIGDDKVVVEKDEDEKSETSSVEPLLETVVVDKA